MIKKVFGDRPATSIRPYEIADWLDSLGRAPATVNWYKVYSHRSNDYDVAALVDKSGKSASHIYARLPLLQLIPPIAEAFTQERITASHAHLLARLPQDAQATAYEQCWRKDWQDKEPHLLPAKHLSAWIQANLYLSLADAPFDREDPTLNTVAGACVTCPVTAAITPASFARRSGRPVPRLSLLPQQDRGIP